MILLNSKTKPAHPKAGLRQPETSNDALPVKKMIRKGLASRLNILNNPHRLFNTTQGRIDYEP